MASGVYFGLALCILTSFSAQVDSNLKQCIPLISDVHKYHQTSSVFFVLSPNNESLKDYTSLHSLSRNFSRQYDLTSIIHLDHLDERINWYHKRILGRSLLVIFLRSLSDIDKFPEKILSKSYISLVIFANESGNSTLCEYCKSPTDNRFRLRFDTEMLVLCCDSLILKEWWSADGNHTEVSDFAFWTDDNRGKLTFLTPAALDTRRYDLKGAGMRIGIVETSPYAYVTGDTIGGLFGDILEELKRSMNFKITGILPSPVYGSYNSTTKAWSGTVGRVVRGEVDLGVTEFTITKDRLDVLEFTIPLAVSMNKLYIRDPRDSDDVNWAAYFKAFSFNTWMVLHLLIILSPILLAVIKLSRNSRTLPSLIIESYLSVWGIFCQQGLSEFPARTSLRLAYFSVFILALIIYAAYTASLVSFLTITPSGLPFTTLEGFVADGSYRLIVPRSNAEYDFFRNSSVPVLKQMMELMKPLGELPETMLAGWEQVCQDRVAFYTIYLPETTTCKVTAIDSGYKDNLAMTMPADNQYSRVINYHIQRLKDTGVMDRIRFKYNDPTQTSAEAEFDQLDLRNVVPVLAILTIGIMLALLMLLAEKIYYALKTNCYIRRSGKSFQVFRTSKPINPRIFIRVEQYNHNRFPVNRWNTPTHN